MNAQIIETIDEAIKARWERFDRLFIKAKGKPFKEDDERLYSYEKTVIDEARRIAVFILNKGDDWKGVWEGYAAAGDGSSFDFVEAIIKDGYDGWDENHSGNSGSASVYFARCLLERPDLFQYLHGALTPLIGDAGYNDDRTDIPKIS